MTVKQAPPAGRRRLVSCKKHKLHYNPDLHSGCVLCRKENLLGARPPERPILRWLGLLLVVAAAGWYLFGRAPEATVPLAEASGAMAPDPYREHITLVDNLLFGGDELAPADAGQAARALEAMITMITRREAIPGGGPAELSPRGRGGVDGLDALAARLRVDTRGAALDARPLRASWSSLRVELFGDQEWFRSRMGGSVAAADPELDAELADDLAAVASSIAAVIDGARSTLAALPDALEAEAAPAYASWATAWDDQLQSLVSELPPPPSAEADAALGLAHRQLDLTIATLARLGRASTGEVVPDRVQREAVLVEAESALAQARAFLAQARQATAPAP